MGSWGWGIVFLLGFFIFLGPIATIIAVVSLGLLAPLSVLIVMAPWIVGVVEGIIYLTMSDESFATKYPPETQRAFRW